MIIVAPVLAQSLSVFRGFASRSLSGIVLILMELPRLYTDLSSGAPLTYHGRFTMPRFVMLVNYTDKGIAAIKDSPTRAGAFREMVAKHGGKVEQQFWCMGAYDGAVVLTAPTDEA